MKLWTVALLGLLLFAGDLPAEDAVEYAKTTKTAAVRKAPQLRLAYKLPDGATLSDTPGLRKAKVGKVALLFVDVDGDGAFDEAGLDGWTFERMPAKARMHYVFPLTPSLVLGADVLRYRVTADGTSVAWTLEKTKASKAVRAGLAMLNEVRVRNAVPPVPMDVARSTACGKHIHYMIVNNAFGHEEIEGKPGWSKDGAYAGIHSVIDQTVTLGEAVERWFATLYHRWPISDPRLASTGADERSPYAMLSPIRDMKDARWAWPALVPAPESEGQPTRAGHEIPMPYPKDETCGYPITLQFPSWESQVANVKAVLRVDKRKGSGKVVECYVSWPGHPANASRPRNDGCICLIPKQPLQGRTRYRVDVEYTWDDKADRRTWTFTTGKDRALPGGRR
ncbi:MAG: hypothetical protein QNJ90_11655 [Planctomycetota bacterium]|nr:hypothetical protein [Planctomycetota bacterium]